MKWVNGWIKKMEHSKDYFNIKNILEYANLLEKYQKKENNLFYKAKIGQIKSIP